MAQFTSISVIGNCSVLVLQVQKLSSDLIWVWMSYYPQDNSTQNKNCLQSCSILICLHCLTHPLLHAHAHFGNLVWNHPP